MYNIILVGAWINCIWAGLVFLSLSNMSLDEVKRVKFSPWFFPLALGSLTIVVHNLIFGNPF